jgi:hypothetical protein
VAADGGPDADCSGAGRGRRSGLEGDELAGGAPGVGGCGGLGADAEGAGVDEVGELEGDGGSPVVLALSSPRSSIPEGSVIVIGLLEVAMVANSPMTRSFAAVGVIEGATMEVEELMLSGRKAATSKPVLVSTPL